MKKKADKASSLKKARAALDQRRTRSSTDESPIYVTFKHSDNLFEIDCPAHWHRKQGSDGAVEFAVPRTDGWIGVLIFRVPMAIDAEALEASGKWLHVLRALFAKVDSTNARSDPTIIYNNLRADRPEEDQTGRRWFVMEADVLLGISTSCSPEMKELYEPVFERMLSSLRIRRDEELLVSRIIARISETIAKAQPDTKIEIDGMTIKTDKFEVSIGNLMTQIKRDPAQCEQLVDQFVRGTMGVFQNNDALGKESWESARKRIQPLIKSDKYIQEANRRTAGKKGSDTSPFLISAPWLADLRICFALDNLDTFRFINSYDIERWGVALETLSQVAIENLTELPEPSLLVMKVSDDTPAVGALQPVGGASSSYLLHPKLFQIASEKIGKDIIAAIPSRDALMLFENRNQKSLLLDAVGRDFSTADHPISDRLFQVTPDGIALL